MSENIAPNVEAGEQTKVTTPLDTVIDPVASGQALDDLFKAHEESDAAAGAEADKATAEADKVAADAAAAAAEKNKSAETPPTDKTVLPLPGDSPGTPPAASDSGALADFEKVALPPYSKPKTAESFDQVKKLARAAVEAREKSIAERDEKIAKLEADNKSRLPAEAEKELAELREFKKALDVEGDPIFKEKFDSRIELNGTLIYKKLIEAGVSQEKIDEMKKLGGVAKVDWEPILSHDGLPANVKRFIESKLNENESLVEEKQIAIGEAKKNAEGFLKRRGDRAAASVAERAARAVEVVNSYIPRMPFAVLKEIPAGATVEQKAAIDKHNQHAKTVHSQINEFLADDSPDMRAATAVGAVLAYQYKTELEQEKAAKGELEKKLVAVTAELDGIKKASATSRVRNGAPAVKTQTTSSPFEYRDAGSALDALRNSIVNAAD